MEHSIRTPSWEKIFNQQRFVRSHSSLYSHIPSLKSFKRLGTWKIFKCMKLSDWDKGLSMTNMHYYSLYNYSQMNMVITYRLWLFFVWLLKFKNMVKGKYTRAFAERPLRWHSSRDIISEEQCNKNWKKSHKSMYFICPGYRNKNKHWPLVEYSVYVEELA